MYKIKTNIMYEFPCVLCITVNGKEGCQANIDKWHNLLHDRASADECLGDQNIGLTRSRISFGFCYLDKFFVVANLCCTNAEHSIEK